MAAGTVAATGTAIAEGGVGLGLAAGFGAAGRVVSALARGNADDPQGTRRPPSSRVVPDFGMQDPDKLAEAQAARDGVAKPVPGGDKTGNDRKTVVGAWNPDDLSARSAEGSGTCAEPNAACNAGVDDIFAHYTIAKSWIKHNYVDKPVCVECRGRTFPHQYEAGTQWAPGNERQGDSLWDDLMATRYNGFAGPVANPMAPLYNKLHRLALLD